MWYRAPQSRPHLQHRQPVLRQPCIGLTAQPLRHDLPSVVGDTLVRGPTHTRDKAGRGGLDGVTGRHSWGRSLLVCVWRARAFGGGSSASPHSQLSAPAPPDTATTRPRTLLNISRMAPSRMLSAEQCRCRRRHGGSARMCTGGVTGSAFNWVIHYPINTLNGRLAKVKKSTGHRPWRARALPRVDARVAGPCAAQSQAQRSTSRIAGSIVPAA
jgi:hypothetical protein